MTATPDPASWCSAWSGTSVIAQTYTTATTSTDSNSAIITEIATVTRVVKAADADSRSVISGGSSATASGTATGNGDGIALSGASATSTGATATVTVIAGAVERGIGELGWAIVGAVVCAAVLA